MKKNKIYQKYFKRLFDLFISILSLILLSPLLVILSFLIRIKLGSPVIFKQKRPGLNEKIFTLYKFRTMSQKKDKNGKLLSDKLRLNKFGKFIRSTSLDELPSLINVIKGDMSIVGPRPLLIDYLDLYSEEQKKRHIVRPGITGYAQVNGRNSLTWKEKFQLDLKYVEDVSFVGDLGIIFKTFYKVISRDGINSSKSETAERFKGEK